MIFLDTSAIYALADLDDDNHDRAVQLFASALRSNEQIVTHNYVIVESAALLQRRLGVKAALAFLNESTRFTVIWVDDGLHGQAACELASADSPRVSLVDLTSFLVMRREGIGVFLGFDKHFADAGFRLYMPGIPPS